MLDSKPLIPTSLIENKILLIRGHKVLLDRDLAERYSVSTSALNKAVSRNLDRFPADFMLQLIKEEFTGLKCHFAKSSWGGTRKLPRAFTEQGIAHAGTECSAELSIGCNRSLKGGWHEQTTGA